MASEHSPPPPPPPAPPAPIIPKGEAAYVEEFNEDDQAGRPETRQTANISTKRSKPDVANTKGVRDEYSDSGYSSHTAATPGSSAPSSLESKVGSNLPKVQENTAASARKPTVLGKTVKSKSQGLEKLSLQNAQNKGKKDALAEASSQRESKPKSKSKSKQLLSGLLKSSKPSSAKIVQDVPKAEPPRPRPSTSQSAHRARPASFHSAPIFVPQQPLIVESRPCFAPPIFPSYPPPQHSYFPPPPVQHIPSLHDFYAPPLSSYTSQPRPRSRQWGQGQQASQRPQSMYYGSSQPMVEYGNQPLYTTIAPGVHSPSHQVPPREPRHVSSEEYPAHPEDYYSMPPPPKPSTKPNPNQRPSLSRNAHTAADAHPSMRTHRTGQEEGTKSRANNRSPTKQSFTEHERSRRPATGSAKRSDEAVPSTHSIERGLGRMGIESNNVKQKPRESFHGDDHLRNLEGSVEAYQASHKTPAARNSVSIDTLARRKKTPGSSSETSSRHSGKSTRSRTSREDSDVRSRRLSSEVKARDDHNNLGLRFSAKQDVNLRIGEGIEGRTISLRQSKEAEGEMELGIGARGRTVGSRPSIAGRGKSRRSSSYIDSQGTTEVERPKTLSRPPRSYSYRDERGLPQLERTRTTSSAAESIKEEQEPRIILERERITTRSRSQRSSRSGYSGWGRVE